MATNKTTVNLPTQMVRNALKMAAASAKRAATQATAKYGPDHIMVQTLHDEANSYENATVE